MRLRQRDLKEIYYRKFTKLKDNEGTSYHGFSEVLKKIKCKVEPAGGKLQREIYGERVNYIKTIYYETEKVDLAEGDGVYIDNTTDKEPDYRVISMRQYGSHIVADIEKVK